ncbi:hypothetical protein [Chamaesiphon sp.]|uniref:hypothetical protein n=1 Tax=Chamaesiphon sp. TaxID=2814140 RepID=UPI0035936760
MVDLPLTGNALLQKIKNLAHLSKRETAKECGYVKISTTGKERIDLSGLYAATLAASGLTLDATQSMGKPGRTVTYKPEFDEVLSPQTQAFQHF